MRDNQHLARGGFTRLCRRGGGCSIKLACAIVVLLSVALLAACGDDEPPPGCDPADVPAVPAADSNVRVAAVRVVQDQNSRAIEAPILQDSSNPAFVYPELLVVYVTVENVGQAASPESCIHLVDDSRNVTAQTQPAIPPGQSVEVPIGRTPTRNTTWNVEVLADALDAMSETNEADNRFAGRLRVYQPTIELEMQLSDNGAEVPFAAPLEYRVDVTNPGDVDLASATLVLSGVSTLYGEQTVEVQVPPLRRCRSCGDPALRFTARSWSHRGELFGIQPGTRTVTARLVFDQDIPDIAVEETYVRGSSETELPLLPHASAWAERGCEANPTSDADRDLLSDEQEGCLAEQFSPVILFHDEPGDNGWPSSVDWMLARSDLRAIATRTSDRIPCRLLEFGVPAHPDFEIMSEAAYSLPVGNCSEAPSAEVRADRGRESIIDNTFGRIYDVEFYLVLDSPARAGFMPPSGLKAPLYVHVYPSQAGGVVVQYWIFTPWNGTEIAHDGDWEHVTVHLDRDLEMTGVRFFHHNDSTWRTRSGSQFQTIFSSGEHPVVYMAEESHASYWSDSSCDGGGVLWADDCPAERWLWTLGDRQLETLAGSQLGVTRDNFYPGGDLINLGERNHESVAWVRYGGFWGGATECDGCITTGSPPRGPLHKDTGTWLESAASFLLPAPWPP